MLASYINTHQLIVSYTQQLLDSKADLDRRALEIRLQGEVQLASEIASNFVTANALADTQESELYLVPYLKNQNHTFVNTALSVVDYKGRAIASNIETKYIYGSSTAFLNMIKTGEAQMDIRHKDAAPAALVFALPVRYRLTNEIEGGVILDIPITSLLVGEIPNYYRWMTLKNGPMLTGEMPDLSNMIVSRTHEIQLPFAGVKLEYYLAQDRNRALSPIDDLLLSYLGISVLAIIGLLVLAKFSARYISEPLEQLSSIAKEVTSSGRITSHIDIHTKDEYGTLADAFNMMFKRLRDAYEDLEAKVAARTKAHELAKLQAEDARNLLHEAVDNITHGLAIYDQDDRLIVFNEAYRQYTMLGDFIQIGRSYREILANVSSAQLFANSQSAEWVQQRIEHHQLADNSALEVKRTDGRWFMLQEVRSPRGYVIASRIDITEIKMTSEALKDAELRWSLSMRGANDGIWDWNLETDQVFYSERWKTMLGYLPEDVGNSPEEWRSRLHPDDSPRAHELLKAHLAGNTEFFNLELRMRCKDGGYKWILTRGKAFINAHGKPIRISGSHTDISEKKIADAIIMERTSQLDAIFALSPDGFVSFDHNHCFKYANPAFFQLTNLDPNLLVGLSEQQFSELIASKCREGARFIGIDALKDRLRMAANTTIDKQSQPNESDGQVIELTTAGNRLLEISMRLAEADTVSEILYVRDVTHEVEVARIKSEFLSTAAHELRTPMASILGYSELMLTRDFPQQRQQQFVEIIHKQAGLVTEILNELLDLQRIESRRGKDFVFTQLNVAQLVADTVGMFKVPDSRLPPTQSITDDAYYILADQSKMIQVINNVLSNAYKYSPNGGDVNIELVTDNNSAYIGIRVQDHGMGMTPEQLQHVFDRFYRADTSGAVPGTGLGMSIVKEIVELHHGHCEIASHAGKGTTVTLWLPLSKHDA